MKNLAQRERDARSLNRALFDERALTRGRGATGSTGSINSPLFQVRDPHMALDPSLFIVVTCAQYVAVVIHSFIHSFMYSVIVVQLTTDNNRSKTSEIEVE